MAQPTLIRVALVFGTALFGGGHAWSNTADICDEAAMAAAAQIGVPKTVMLALTQTETGRNRQGALRPWPWTVNMEGVGKWFDTRQEAEEYALRHYSKGARSFDVGCFQVNYRWHGQNFDDVSHMFDPLANATYAAQFVSALYDETGDWNKAAGYYHSRTQERAQAYQARFTRIRDMIDVDQATIARIEKAATANSFPFLKLGHNGRGASLVPVGQAQSGFTLIAARRGVFE